MPQNLPELTAELLVGVWIAISTQTITVTHMQADGSMQGTYFTPAANLKATFSGVWELEGDELSLTYQEGLPVSELPLLDSNRIEVISRDEVLLHTLPHGISLAWKRVDFQTKALASAKPAPKAPSEEVLRAMELDDLFNENPLANWIYEEIDQSLKTDYDEKMLDGLTNRVPEKAGFYMAMFQFEGLWGNGGMQHVLLREPVPTNLAFLDLVAKAYDHFGHKPLAKLVRELKGKTAAWMKTIETLHEQGADDEAFEPVWAEVDAYDDVFDEVSESGPNVYEALIKDIQAHPGDYTSP